MRLGHLFFGTTAVATASSRTIDMRLMTYNIRLAVGVGGPGEELWSVRRPLMTSQLNHEAAGRPEALMCFQEAIYPQVQDLDEGLGNEWTYVGVGRDDGAFGGEFSPIFYRPSVWKLEKNATYWLSETPNEPGSVGWDAALPRIVTVARFRHDSSGARIAYMCTHFDHIGQEAREQSAHLLVGLAGEWSTHNNKSLPVFLGGDLNVTPDNPAYQTLASDMYDAKHMVPEERRFGNVKTYTAFTVDADDDTEIDHIFVRDPAGLDWVSFAVLNTRFEDEIFISDHRPVVVDFKMPSQAEARHLG
ncbi:endonuclease/Exonuclease/phosphatase [Dactylonectria estremocensis]|uniref:Endonuclease/Exonuclease/phosphatase n=1 Tax=Dactylonectria estremocensis TaxID=1079267 RepID=A0A9P9JBP7_9HYPO|nr:endonuclease/Exonuclease/phosphatase [Dactylonectria estremocensis]